MSALLEVRRLRKEFPQLSPLLKRRVGTVAAVDGVDLALDDGELVALVGESGSGKTTLGRSILRLIEPTSGEIRFRGEDLLALDREAMRRRRRNLQMVFQDPYSSLNPRLRVRDALFEPVEVHGLARRSERDAVVARLLAEVGLPGDAAGKYPHEFSGGQRQRIGIARALATSPDLLIADEPVSALDVSVRAQVINLLLELRQRRNLAILFIAHDLALVGRIADRIVVLYLGRVVEEGPATRVLREPRHPYTVALLSAVPSLQPGAAGERILLPGDPPSPAHPPPGCRFHPRCPVAEARCRVESPTLEATADGRRIACHFPGRLLAVGVEPFPHRDVKRTDASHGATQ
ncbi:MAG: ABC transporter ATP-binding protein [Thermoanaerobaculia bacterium]|nr:ABC transporter ATP-binding protein [Thermoanaerobaculia bacterium]